MAEKILMIALSPTMEEGTIVRWNKKEGDPLAIGDLLCEVETDKATMEYESQAEGTLLKIVVPDGGQAKVADLIGIAGESGEDVSAMVTEAKEAAAASAAAPAAAPAAPAVPSSRQAPPAAAAPAAVVAAPNPAASVAAPQSAGGFIKASPLARKLANDRGIELATVPGSGPGGRVVKRDIESYQPTAAATVARAVLADETIPVSGKRKVIAQRLAESKFQAPHYYLTVSFEMDGLMSARSRLNAKAKEKVSLNAFIHKVVAEALRKNPMINSSWQGETIRRFGSVDIGLAVAVTDGLITPVVRDCVGKGLIEIDQELKILIPKAQEGRLQPEEYSGATFTISNLGSFGIEEFTAVINPPGSAILALGKIQKSPVVTQDDELEIRQLMKATLSCDHRVIDGAAGAAFLADLKEIIENPFAALY